VGVLGFQVGVGFNEKDDTREVSIDDGLVQGRRAGGLVGDVGVLGSLDEALEQHHIAMEGGIEDISSTGIIHVVETLDAVADGIGVERGSGMEREIGRAMGRWDQARAAKRMREREAASAT